jgi:hypothetical protein
MLKCDNKKLIKYGLFVAIIYALLKMIPRQQLSSNDNVLVVGTLLFVMLIVDNINCEGFADVTNFYKIDQPSAPSSNITYAPAPVYLPYISENGAPILDNAGSATLDNTGSTNDNSSSIPKTTCDLQLDQIKKDFEKQIQELKTELSVKGSAGTESSTVKYYNQLIRELRSNGILDDVDVKNVTLKLNSKLLTLDEAITSLEKVKEKGIVKDKSVNSDFVYNELPSEFYAPLGKRIVSDWENEYNLLDTTNWQVPMQRPPVCIASEKCKICPKETSPGTSLLKDWDSSRKITDFNINKKWASNN